MGWSAASREGEGIACSLTPLSPHWDGEMRLAAWAFREGKEQLAGCAADLQWPPPPSCVTVEPMISWHFLGHIKKCPSGGCSSWRVTESRPQAVCVSFLAFQQEVRTSEAEQSNPTAWPWGQPLGSAETVESRGPRLAFPPQRPPVTPTLP